MKISEMEYHHSEYTSLEDKIKKMLDNREFPVIFSVCVESFPHIVPAIRYRKKKDITSEMPDWSVFDVICQYAPPLFEHAVIESLFEFIKSNRMLAKHEKGYLQAAVETAIDHEEIARVLWNSIEQQPDALQKDIYAILKPNLHVGAEKIIDIWEKFGVVIRHINGFDFSIRLQTRTDDVMEGRCHNCGIQGKGRKELFFKSFSCQKCGFEGYYHIKYPDIQQ